MIKSGQENLVRCVECETVHSVQVERERLVNLKVIVSNDELSMPYYIKIPAREMLRVGDELLVDDPAKDVVMTQIASLETDRRVGSAPAEEVKTSGPGPRTMCPLRSPSIETARPIRSRSSFPAMRSLRWEKPEK